jgi:hypothetical protein
MNNLMIELAFFLFMLSIIVGLLTGMSLLVASSLVRFRVWKYNKYQENGRKDLYDN